MEAQDSSEEEEHQRFKGKSIADYTQFDESFEVKNAEEVESPAESRRESETMMLKRPKSKTITNNNNNNKQKDMPTDTDVRSPRQPDFRRYSVPEGSYNKSMGLESESEDSEDSEDVDMDKVSRMKLADFYDAKQFEELKVSGEVSELFQNIMRYTPQKMSLRYKLIPFLPDFIPAVGDIDAFLKIPRPDGQPDKMGLTVLDEPAGDQSEPAVLQLRLRSKTRSATTVAQVSVVKRLEDAPKHGRMIDKWIEDMSQLHRSKPPPAVQLTHRFPTIDIVMQPWPSEIEETLYLGPTMDLEKLDCNLLQAIDLVCSVLDIPVYGEARIESLHTLFAVYSQIHNSDIEKVHD